MCAGDYNTQGRRERRHHLETQPRAAVPHCGRAAPRAAAKWDYFGSLSESAFAENLQEIPGRAVEHGAADDFDEVVFHEGAEGFAALNVANGWRGHLELIMFLRLTIR